MSRRYEPFAAFKEIGNYIVESTALVVWVVGSIFGILAIVALTPAIVLYDGLKKIFK